MNPQDIDARIGEAWQAHYDGHDDVAIEKFQVLIKEVPENIDAHWGLGLSYRDSGNRVHAMEVFQKVKQLITTLIEAEGGELGRYFMLSRMVDQQIGQMEEFFRADQS
jgi:lipopolysaccharide biosynthesis regulator YciM